MRKLSDLVPGGCHTYSKGDRCFPSNAPEYLVKAEGCYVWDNKGNKFIDWAMGLRSVILGHGYKKVEKAVIKALSDGVNFCRPSLLEFNLAELMVEKIPSAEMVKFSKTGSNVTSAAVRLARAYTGKRLVLIAEENPIISGHDWFIGMTPLNDGIPMTTCYDVEKYSYNNLEETLNSRVFYFNDVAAIVLDPATVDITKEKLQYIRDLCTKHGIVFILDEMISGIRYGVGGVQGLLGVTPDLSTFGKALGNGFSVAALCGNRDIMKLGDREHGNVFLLSGTHSAETTGLAAAWATIIEIADKPQILQHVNTVGRILVQNIQKKINTYGLNEHVNIKHIFEGRNPSMSFSSMELKTIFDQHMVECGILMPYIAPSFAHSHEDIEKTLNAVEFSLKMVAKALESKDDLKKFCFDEWVERPVFKRGDKK